MRIGLGAEAKGLIENRKIIYRRGKPGVPSSKVGRLVELYMGRSKACRRISDRLGGGFNREVEGECARYEWHLVSGMEWGNTTL